MFVSYSICWYQRGRFILEGGALRCAGVKEILGGGGESGLSHPSGAVPILAVTYGGEGIVPVDLA